MLQIHGKIFYWMVTLLEQLNNVYRLKKAGKLLAD